MGYLSQVRSGGYQYIYLTEYCGNQEFNSKKEVHVYKFGNTSIALYKMKRWLRRYEEEFPAELLDRGYTKKDLISWINTIEKGITKTGKKFNVEMKKRAVF